MSIRLFIGAILIAGGVLAAGAAPALAAPTPDCSASQPATLQFQQSSSERTIQLESGNQTAKEYQFPFEITGCRLGQGSHEVRLIGLAAGAGVVASLDIRPSGLAGALVIDPSNSRLAPNNYPLTAVSDDPAIDLFHPLTINVKNSAALSWIVWSLFGLLLGLIVLAARAAVANEGAGHWTNFWSFFSEPKTLFPALGGVAAVWGVIQSRVISNESWYGSTAEDLGLMVGVLGAMIAGGTAITALSGASATTRERDVPAR